MDIDYDDMIEDYIQEANEEPPQDELDYEESLLEEMMAANTATAPAPSTPVHTARGSQATETMFLEQLDEAPLAGNDDGGDLSSVRERLSESRGTVDVFAFERYDRN